MQPAPRGTWTLLRDRTFGPYFWGNAVSNAGIWAYTVAAVVLVFQITGSALQVGLVAILQFSASVLLSPVGGALADRWDRRRLIISAQAMAAVAAASLAGWVLWTGSDGLTSAVPVLAMSLMFGITTGLNDPARHSLVPALVPSQDLGQAVALNALTFNLGRAVGPAIGGLLLVSAGPGAVILLTAVSYLLFVGLLLTVRPAAVADRPPFDPDADRGFAAGVRYVWRHKPMLALLVGIAAAGYGSDPVITLVPLLAEDLLAASSGSLGIASSELAAGVLAGAFGGGGVLGMVVIRALHSRAGYRRVGVTGLALQAVMVTVLAVAPNLATGSGALVVAGVGYFLGITSMTTLLQLSAPDHLRGRVMALWGVFFLGSRPVAALVDSALANAASLPWALLSVVAVLAAAAVVVARATGGTPHAVRRNRCPERPGRGTRA